MAYNPHAYQQVQEPVRQVTRPPKKGWVWSDRLQKYRRPAIRKFMADRQGIHIILGFLVGLLLPLFAVLGGLGGVGVGYAVDMAADQNLVGWMLAGALIGDVIGLLPVGLLTHIFLRYEEVEAKEIEDDAYIDIGGYLGGLMASLYIWVITQVTLTIWAVVVWFNLI